MSDWVLAIEGTQTGRQFALFLALTAALLHAIFGALQKGRHDPWLSRGVIDGCYALIALPIALFVVPWPEPHMWMIFAIAFLIHSGYKCLQAMAYTRGAFTVVYPVVRGTGPLITVVAAQFIFLETLTVWQWLGVACLTSGILALSLEALAHERHAPGSVLDRKLHSALGLAVATGLFVAAYTVFDAYGIRATRDPFTFLAWFFLIDGLLFPWIAFRRYKIMIAPPPPLPLLVRGVVGAFVAFFSFGSIMLATRLDKVGETAVLRETSTVFAAVIGWLFLRERVGPVRAVLMVVIAAGAVVVEWGG